ncbi:EAL domain-containing protein [Ectopseudomonas hydrolytica]|uniref:EAL domain-containing protein n=1 Tax=Ectopseudomonas hydrolytica TaxID=2493633 RepID=A0ABY5AA78_9GAMM|nr:EAL domain-containing protein [Pseudomonas hydrolytica]USR40605.1 EAL domain-containing protein [Pseudomonas hydrolytica]
MSTPSSQPSSPSGESRAPRREALRRVLMALVLAMLGLLAWQLTQEYRQLLDSQKQLSRGYSEQLAKHLSLNMRLKAQAGQAMLQAAETRGDVTAPIAPLRSIFPTLQSIVWLDAQGQRLADSAGESPDLPFIRALQQRIGAADYHFAFSPQDEGALYLLLRQDDESQRVLRLRMTALRDWLREQHHSEHDWLLEDLQSRRVMARADDLRQPGQVIAPVTAAEQAQSLELIALPGSDWQLRALFDADRAGNELMPTLAGKFLLFTLCSLLTLLALYGLQREQRRLQRLNTESRRSLRQAASALAAVEERILVTQADGKLRYLNPQAEALFGLSSEAAWDRHLLDLLPDLDPLLLNSPQAPSDLGPELVRVEQQGRGRLFAVTRSDISELGRQAGYVWVLRDVTDEQQAMRVLQETRRRYQDIFEGTGVALCVLDLAGLRSFLLQQKLRDAAGLNRWLQADARHHQALLDQLHITEANQVALNLLGVKSTEQAWQQLFDNGPLQPDDLRYRLAVAVLEGPNLVELETQLVTAQGLQRHVWLVLRLPEMIQDYQAVTLSISDITSRKRIELSLIERERFWSEVVRSVPDLLYVHDMQNKRVLFSNHSLGLPLGYSKTELKAMEGDFWERVLHPDDSDYYWRIRNLQKVVGDGLLLESVLRWRHRDGQWRWFSIREQALARDERGRVSRLIGVAKDITEQIERNQSLRDSEQRYRLLAESISDVIFSTDSALHLNYVSPSVEPVLGYSVDWVMANSFYSLAANPQQLNGLNLLLERIRDSLGERDRLERLREELPDQLFVFDCLRADGHKIPVELRLVLMWDENGRFEGILGVGRDISQQRRAEKDLRMAATVFEHSTAAILVTDPAGYIVQVNKAFSRVSGYSAGQVLDQLPGMLTADRQQAAHLQYILSQLNQRGSWEGEVWLKRKGGENFPAWVGITAVHDEEGDLVSYVCFFSDISERKASEQRIHRLAYYDALTHLPNRTLFQDRLHSALQHAERHNEWVVLMFLDLDRFKPINDSLGHAAGDRMLKDVAVRLSACVDGDDTVARMGGDEFTLLLQPRATREGALNRAIHVAEQILDSLARPFVLEGREFFVTASIGIALAPQDGDELSQLMKNADTAMYHAKERGKNNFQFYQADMNASALERLELESDLRHAQEQGQFVLHYQPQFSGDGRRLTGVEALLRWNHPGRGLVPPTDFIPVLEELGLVVQVGEWVLEEACRQLKTWHDEKIRIPKISVNLSARQFAEGDLSARIAAILERTGVAPACLEVELTESILMRDVASAMQTLGELKRLGLCIAVDDFGTGYSSLNYLKQFPIDVLKIDRSFVDGLPDGEQDAQIARAIIAMAHSLNMMVIAEGVESHAQLEFLREHGCDEVQGYLLGRPMQPRQFSAQFGGAALFMFS